MKTIAWLAAACGVSAIALATPAVSTPKVQGCGDTTCAADIGYSAGQYWLISALVSNGKGYEFCETCENCNITMFWVFSPPGTARYKVKNPDGSEVTGGAGGAAGDASGFNSKSLGCDDVVQLSDAWQLSDTYGAGTSFNVVPLCPCQ